MAGVRIPGPIGQEPAVGPVFLPMPRQAAAGPLKPPQQQPKHYQSQTVTAEVVQDMGNAVAGMVQQLSFDSFVRIYVYEPGARAIAQQGANFVKQGIMTTQEAAEWVNAQRNAWLIRVRDTRNTPLGRAYSEFLKPRDKLPKVPDLLEKLARKQPSMALEQRYEAIIKSGGSTRASVNKMAITLRWAGPVLLVAQVGVAAYIVADAPPESRWQVGAEQGGAIVGGSVGGWLGAKYGCAGGAAIGVWFEVVGAVPGCLIGGIAGAFGGGWAGSSVGREAGYYSWKAASSVAEWL